MGFEFAGIEKDVFQVRVPSYRSDVIQQADIVEEVLRIFGYNRVKAPPVKGLPSSGAGLPNRGFELQLKVSSLLAGMGYYEILTNPLTDIEIEKRIVSSEQEIISLQNPSSEDLNCLKTTSLFSGLQAISWNHSRKQDNFRLFEFSVNYSRSSKAMVETSVLNFFLHGREHEESWQGEGRDLGIFSLKNDISGIFSMLGADHLCFHRGEDTRFVEQVLTVHLHPGEDSIGSFGYVLASHRSRYSLSSPVVFGELQWDKVLELPRPSLSHTPASKFPEVRRDLSLILEVGTPVEEIYRVINDQQVEIVQRVNIFSVFEGSQIGKNKISIAIAFYLQSPDRTLADEEIDAAMNGFIESFEKKLGAFIRR